MGALIVVLYILFGLVTTALSSIVSWDTQDRTLTMAEIVITFLLWPYFLVALIVYMNTHDDE